MINVNIRGQRSCNIYIYIYNQQSSINNKLFNKPRYGS